MALILVRSAFANNGFSEGRSIPTGEAAEQFDVNVSSASGGLERFRDAGDFGRRRCDGHNVL